MELRIYCGKGITLLVEVSSFMSAKEFLLIVDNIRELLGYDSKNIDEEDFLKEYHARYNEHHQRIKSNHLPIDQRLDYLEQQNAHILALLDIMASKK